MKNRKGSNLGALFSAIQHYKYQDIKNIIQSKPELLETPSSSGIYAWQKVSKDRLNERNDKDMQILIY